MGRSLRARAAQIAQCASAQTPLAALIILRDSVPRFAGNGSDGKPTRERTMSIGTILLVVLILMLVGVLPVWPHASSWGYGPSGIVGVILLVIIVLFLMGRL